MDLAGTILAANSLVQAKINMEEVMTARQAYQEKIKARLAALDAEIGKLRAQAIQTGADAQAEYHAQIKKVEQKQCAAQDSLKKLQSKGNEAWDDLKAGTERAAKALDTAVRSASSRL